MGKYTASKIIGNLGKYVGLIKGVDVVVDLNLIHSQGSTGDIIETLISLGVGAFCYGLGADILSNCKREERLDDLKNIGKLEKKVGGE